MKSWSDFKIEIPASGGAERRTTCPECSHSRKKKNAKCLDVNIDKEVWLCHHCGWSGTLKQGVRDQPRTDRWKPQAYTRPEYRAEPPNSQLVEFFAERGIPQRIVEQYEITLGMDWMPQQEEYVPCIRFPYHRIAASGEREVINVKMRTLIGKDFRQIANAEKILYGLPDITGTEIVIVEGECDKLALATAGILYAVSVPDGAPAPNAKPTAKKFEYLENCEAELEPLTKIIIATDNDPPGAALKQELIRRLGPERCWTVTWPDGVKDANELLLSQGPDALRRLIDEAQPCPIENVLSMHDLAGELIRYYNEGRRRGLSTGWPNVDEFITFAPGELTVVTGIPSHGKSEWIDALMINLMDLHGSVFAICSPENRPIEYHLAKLAEKVTGLPFLPGPSDRMSAVNVVEALDWLEPRLYIIDAPETLSIETLLMKARALVLQKGITHLVIDPWNEFDHTRDAGMTETEYISKTLSRMKAFCRRHLVHIIIVAHPAKMLRQKDGTYPIPSPYDISGSAHWRNKPDNCVTVWRNVEFDPHYSEIHTTKVRFKQNGRIGVAALEWNPVCGRYYPTTQRDTSSGGGHE